MGTPQPPYLVHSLWFLLLLLVLLISTCLAALKPFASPVSTDRENGPIVFLLQMAFNTSEKSRPPFFVQKSLLVYSSFGSPASWIYSSVDFLQLVPVLLERLCPKVYSLFTTLGAGGVADLNSSKALS